MDLYSVLGVSSSASAGEIERAYRKLARQFHPGLNPGDRHAEERFRQVDAAYQVLGDEARRREYDGQGSRPAASDQIEHRVSFAGFDFSAPADGPTAATFSELFAEVFQDAARRATSAERGLEIDASLPLTFEEALRGGRFQLSVSRQEPCEICGGEGWTARSPAPCPECGGQGTRQWARGHMVFTKKCERCEGRGALTSQGCRACGGAGLRSGATAVMIDVPPGVESGARLVMPGCGHAVRGGAPGDLYVTVAVAAHPFFRRAGDDVVLTLPVAVHEAALGARVDVPTLDGPVKLRIPAGTASGQRFRLRGRGVPSRTGDPDHAGDLVVEIAIVLPPVRDERSRELLKEFGRLNDVDVRGHLFRCS
jgi:molecular chaperone DnaJ